MISMGTLLQNKRVALLQRTRAELRQNALQLARRDVMHSSVDTDIKPSMLLQDWKNAHQPCMSTSKLWFYCTSNQAQQIFQSFKDPEFKHLLNLLNLKQLSHSCYQQLLWLLANALAFTDPVRIDEIAAYLLSTCFEEKDLFSLVMTALANVIEIDCSQMCFNDLDKFLMRHSAQRDFIAREMGMVVYQFTRKKGETTNWQEVLKIEPIIGWLLQSPTLSQIDCYQSRADLYAALSIILKHGGKGLLPSISLAKKEPEQFQLLRYVERLAMHQVELARELVNKHFLCEFIGLCLKGRTNSLRVAGLCLHKLVQCGLAEDIAARTSLINDLFILARETTYYEKLHGMICLSSLCEHLPGYALASLLRETDFYELMIDGIGYFQDESYNVAVMGGILRLVQEEIVCYESEQRGLVNRLREGQCHKRLLQLQIGNSEKAGLLAEHILQRLQQEQ